VPLRQGLPQFCQGGIVDCRLSLFRHGIIPSAAAKIDGARIFT
jgi:hypothetical protein